MRSLNEHCQAAFRHFGKRSLKNLAKKKIFITAITENPEDSSALYHLNLEEYDTGIIRNLETVRKLMSEYQED